MLKKLVDLAFVNRVIKQTKLVLSDVDDNDLESIVEMVCDVAESSATREAFIAASEEWELPVEFRESVWRLCSRLSSAKNPRYLERFRETRHEEVPVQVLSSFPGLSLSNCTPACLQEEPSRGEGEVPLGLGPMSGIPLELMEGLQVAQEDEEDDEGGWGRSSGGGNSTGGNSVRGDAGRMGRRKRPLSDYERWELMQLQASGVACETVVEAPPALEESVLVDIEVRAVEPKFLKGQTVRSGVKADGVSLLGAPDGTLARSAATSGVLARERREAARESQQDRGRPWEASNERALRRQRRFVDLRSLGPREDKSIAQRRRDLPIFSLRRELLDAVANHQVLVMIGETGSGKTTQLPQYLAEAGYGERGIVACTQPRRVAATSIAQRVADEYGCRLGQEVGYTIRFDDMSSADTLIKYMTDGILLRECVLDVSLPKYSVIILDEAHERTIATDVLFGLLKTLVTKRPDLKLIITSATLDAEKFSAYFNDAPIFIIPGRSYKVDIYYSKTAEPDYLEAALLTVMQIHLTEPAGDILVFLTGQEEIESACAALHNRMEALADQDPPPLIILPVYASLPSEMQTLIFEPPPPGSRKCVVATNIAEASLTIDGIKFVVDPGVAKVKVYSAKTGIESLTAVPISQANAKQRSGRAGRTGPGKCFRLYTEDAFNNEMLPTAVPEIQRSELCSTVLQLKALGVNDLLHFDFMDAPPVVNLIQALETLYELKALDDDGYLTTLGKRMAEFPMEPQMAKTLLAALDLDVGTELITISSMLQIENIFYRPRDKQEQAETKKGQFVSIDGDHITYLNVYNAWSESAFSKSWCYENFIQYSSMRKAQEIRKQLINILCRYSPKFRDSIRFENQSSTRVSKRKSEKIRQAICAGYFRNVAKKDPQEGYKTLLEDQQVFLHPMSSIYSIQSQYVLYHRLMLTTKEYIKDCCVINPKWLTAIAPHLFEETNPNKLTAKKLKDKIQPLANRHEDPNAWRLSRRRI
ncbi:putative ATP-dependent RNA helicase [Gregarina niphandrodes]|uniref:RNA helicase n=1 Tax=Gregarina niphandrodes TaxID=110365 RepID=A0A023BC53_GRENI|nr:putative ATP-dependent RNA helicase [Gregarina niphandrodes]EZG82239.1 putative ATP-dependent RNA helicase [Gregarina niphandrodes]|eukprot:XP_011129020.1 putative ATP-dependent RNA helicase [Gregarina niphandrodes]